MSKGTEFLYSLPVIGKLRKEEDALKKIEGPYNQDILVFSSSILRLDIPEGIPSEPFRSLADSEGYSIARHITLTSTLTPYSPDRTSEHAISIALLIPPARGRFLDVPLPERYVIRVTGHPFYVVEESPIATKNSLYEGYLIESTRTPETYTYLGDVSKVHPSAELVRNHRDFIRALYHDLAFEEGDRGVDQTGERSDFSRQLREAVPA